MGEITVYEQLTISDWLAMKEKLRLELQNVTQSFVRIGYALRKIDDEKMYETDGYKSIAEFAKKEYGLEASTVSRFMSINKEYSVDGYSERLRPEYNGIGQSKLSEMLQLTDRDRELITPNMQRSDIRELKNFNKSLPEKGVADDIRELIEAFFRDNRKDLNDLYGMADPERTDDHVTDLQAKIELLNPSGSRVYRKGLYMLFFYEENIKIKKYGEDPVAVTYGDFLTAVDEVFGVAAAGYQTWEKYFGEEPEKEEVAPAQKVEAAEPEEASEIREETSGNAWKAEQSVQKAEESAQKTEESAQNAVGSGQPRGKDSGSETKSAVTEKSESGPAVKEERREEAPAMNMPEEDPEAAAGPSDIAGAMNEPEEEICTKYRDGDVVLVSGKIDMVTVRNDGTANYRIRTATGKTMWCTDQDIAGITVED